MRFDKYSFPHPVFGLGDDISGESPSAEVNVNDDADNEFVVTVSYSLSNADIERMIAEGKAAYYCEITCSATLFREVVQSQDVVRVFTLPRDLVRGKVEFLCLVVTTESIDDYLNADTHPELAGIATSLDCGDVLAYLGETDFIADIAFDKLRAASTFMEIVEGDNDTGPFEVILDDPKIQIRLSKADYAVYTQPAIGQNLRLASLFQSSVAMPALVYAIQQLSNGRADDYREKAWAQAIDWRIQNQLAGLGLTLDSESALRIAQLLLGAPVERLLTDLNTPRSDEDGD